MIAEFRVKNFYSVKTEQILSFEPTSDTFKGDEYCINVKDSVKILKIAMIYGANASGKTNILMALSFFRDLMIGIPIDKTEEIGFSPFLLDSESRNDKTEMAMSFYLESERYTLSIVFDNDRIYTEKLDFYPGTQPANLYYRSYNPETDSTEITFGNKLKINKNGQLIITGNTINNCTVLAAFGKSNVESSRLNIVYGFFSNYINDVLRPQTLLTKYTKRHLDKDKNNELKRFLIHFLKASDFNISNLALIKEEDAPIMNAELVFYHETDNGGFSLSEDLESKGTIRFMGLGVLLKQLLEENRVIGIDEIETSLHYELLSYFIRVFLANSNGSSQLILTTHDINLLDEDFVRRDTVWFTDKDSCGETKLTRLSSLGLHKNLSPYNAYRQGKLVKLPFLGSIYLTMEK
ncbi:MAG: ATP-binding protein [Tannerellaceae bacterium]|jgi:AAA15 family ATPase/GTPase|nr:ATP-binding protein [Tannerellaceae bacterium]